MIVIAADERDIVRLRTNIRRERTYLYRLRITPSAMRSLFLAYVGEANDLVGRPRFYHTLTGNCTILVYKLLRRIVGPLPARVRVRSRRSGHALSARGVEALGLHQRAGAGRGHERDVLRRHPPRDSRSVAPRPA